MALERMRRQVMNNPDLFPEFHGRTKANETPQVISIASSSSSTTSSEVAHSKGPHRNGTIVISSDEESGGEGDLGLAEPNNNQRSIPVAAKPASVIPLKPSRIDNAAVPQKPLGFKPAVPKSTQGIPIQIPSNKDYIRPMALNQGEEDGEVMPHVPDDHVFISPEDAEKALRDLMSGGMNDTETDINMEEATVKGFKEGIKLLPHQIIGRAWMRDREDLSKKRTGGILADDMGLGKTIQTLTRIVEGRARKSDKDDGWAATTLVVCPLALIGQWEDEIIKMTEDVTVIKHHGPTRTADPSVLRRKRVVVTTYDVVKSEYEAHISSAKDESQAKTSRKKNKSADSDADSDDSVEHFGRTIASKTKKSKAPKKSALFQVQWWRIVLDEAHNIKNKATKGAIACCELEGKFRWCLTGTPMQNSVVELYSLLKFLRIKPFSNWNSFNLQIAKPVQTGRGGSTAMKRLQVVLKQIMLRRRKDQYLNGKALIELPGRFVNIVSCPFDTSEQAFYDSLENKMESMIEKLMANSKGNSNYMSVLLLLLRLRQACNHPSLVIRDYKADIEAVEPKSKKNQDPDGEDADDLADMFGELGVSRKCQLCTAELVPKNVSRDDGEHCIDCAPMALKVRRGEDARPSSAKIRMILKVLREIDERSEGQEKTIIFSQFTTMLDLIEPFLQDKGVGYVRYDGKMISKEREGSIKAIKENKRVKVILISFKAGSTGLNLTACNNVILVDLWWNPALEDQAFDRAHRFGQKRDVNIFKLKIDNSVEDRILALQEKKRELARAALSGDRIKDMRLGMDDLLALFRPGARDEDD